MFNSGIEFKNLSKIYGDCVANQDISFKVAAGTIHALVGENGAGKSTLMKMLFGLEPASSGAILHSPHLKIGMVHQHFMKANQVSALEHLLLDDLKGGLFRPFRKSQIRGQAESLMQRFALNIDLNKLVKHLSVVEQQKLEIIRLLMKDCDLLIFDEPTAVLPPTEVEHFLKRMLALKAQGKTQIFISHRLQEVRSVADAVTVLRQGRVSWNGSTAEKTDIQIAEMMVGGTISKVVKRPADLKNSEKPLIQIKNLSTGNLSQISLQIHAGEVLALAGLEGNGQIPLIQFLADPRSANVPEDTYIFEDVNATHLSNHELRKQGLRYIGPDRLKDSVVLEMTALENLQLGATQQVTAEMSRTMIHNFGISPARPDLKMGQYSGGNQQKWVVGRESTLNSPRLVIAAHPTRGVDLGAKAKIHQTLLDVCKKQAAVLLVSSDLEEILEISDRVLVLSKGQIIGELKGSSISEESIARLMAGAL